MEALEFLGSEVLLKIARRRLDSIPDKLGGPLTQAPPATYSASPCWELVKNHPGRHELMRFSRWLWNSQRDMAFVVAVLSDCLEHNPLNPYAYYQKNSSARDSITMKQNELESSSLKEGEL